MRSNNSRLVVGIDPGTHSTGFSVLEVTHNNDVKCIEFATINYKEKDMDYMKRILHIVTQIENLLFKNDKINISKLRHLVIEKEFMTGGFRRDGRKRSGNVKVSYMLNQLIGATCHMFYSNVTNHLSGKADSPTQTHGLSIATVSPPTWKKLILGNGWATKDDIICYVMQKYPECDASEIKSDVADSICIAEYYVRTYILKETINTKDEDKRLWRL